MNDKISIILPVYNVEKYLNKCIDSILNQSYKNFELIIIDDGSTDNSGNICDSYNTDSRVTIIHQDNKGLSAARNKGIDMSTGNYITFIDSDDYIDNKYIEILYKLITKYNTDISVCNFIKFTENKNKNNDIDYNYNEELITKEEAYKRMLSSNGVSYSIWTKLYKKKIFNNIKFIPGKIYEDVYIVNDIMEKVNKIAITDYKGYYYLKRESSIMRSSMSKNQMDLIDASTRFRNYMLQNYPQFTKYINREFINANFTIYRKAIYDKSFKKEYTSIRKVILSHKKTILTSKVYSIKLKIQTLLLLFGNTPYKIFYKIYKKGC